MKTSFSDVELVNDIIDDVDVRYEGEPMVYITLKRTFNVENNQTFALNKVKKVIISFPLETAQIKEVNNE